MFGVVVLNLLPAWFVCFGVVVSWLFFVVCLRAFVGLLFLFVSGWLYLVLLFNLLSWLAYCWFCSFVLLIWFMLIFVLLGCFCV